MSSSSMRAFRLDDVIDWNALPMMAASKELAAFLGIPEQTLRRWRSRKAPYGPPYEHQGRSVIYKRDRVRRWWHGGGSHA
jgi:hypothetical protein